MKICIFTDSFLPFISGVTSAIVTQANELARRDHKIIIFSPVPYDKTKKHKKLLHSTIKFYDLPISFPIPKIKDFHLGLPSVVKSANIIKKFKPDIIHAHTEFGTGWEGLICSKLFKIPIVGNFHTVFGEPSYGKLLGIPNLKLLQRFIWNYSISFLNKCDFVVTPSKSTARELLKHGLDKKPVVLSNGIAMPKIPKKIIISKTKTKYKINNGINIIYVGRISYEKSLDIVLKAFKIVAGKNYNTKLIIVGDGKYMDKLKELISEFELNDKVILTGNMSHHKLINSGIYCLGNIFITASKTETQSLSIVEAMAFGLPIVSVRARAIPEIVKQNYNGFLAKPDDYKSIADYLNILIKDNKLMEKMGHNSLLEVKKHSIKYVCNELENIYKKAILKNSKRKTNYRIEKLRRKARIIVSKIDKKLEYLKNYA